MVKLHIKGNVDVPMDTEAVVSNLSAIGEQRLDFRPRVRTTARSSATATSSHVADTAVPRRFDTIITAPR